MIKDPERGDDLFLIKEYLKNNWKESREFREVDVPIPNILVEGDRRIRGGNFSDDDLVIVSDGGTVQYEPASVGFRDYKITSPIDIQIRSSKGYQRFDGGRDDDSYGGLTGEVEALLDDIRYGFEQYDIVLRESFDDNTSAHGADVFDGVWSVRFIAYANSIVQTGNK